MNQRLAWLAALIVSLAFLGMLLPVLAHDDDPEVMAWMGTLREPDQPTVSCCGVCDAFIADKVEIVDGKVFAIITDTRHLKCRNDVPVGTRVEIPPNKMGGAIPKGNPTEHTFLFMNPETHYVYCYVQSSGT